MVTKTKSHKTNYILSNDRYQQSHKKSIFHRACVNRCPHVKTIKSGQVASCLDFPLTTRDQTKERP